MFEHLVLGLVIPQLLVAVRLGGGMNTCSAFFHRTRRVARSAAGSGRSVPGKPTCDWPSRRHPEFKSPKNPRSPVTVNRIPGVPNWDRRTFGSFLSWIGHEPTLQSHAPSTPRRGRQASTYENLRVAFHGAGERGDLGDR